MNSKTDKKQLIIFLIVAYGITFLMGFPMWYGYSRQLDLTAFVNTQMMYPAAWRHAVISTDPKKRFGYAEIVFLRLSFYHRINAHIFHTICHTAGKGS